MSAIEGISEVKYSPRVFRMLTHVRHRRLRIAAVQLEPLTPFRWAVIPAVIAALLAVVGEF